MASPPNAVERSLAPPHDDPRFEGARVVVERLLEAGYETYLVGGCVRDLALGRSPKDFDIATAATPDEVDALFRWTIGVGKAFGVMQVKSAGQFFEVATFRMDMEYISSVVILIHQFLNQNLWSHISKNQGDMDVIGVNTKRWHIIVQATT